MVRILGGDTTAGTHQGALETNLVGLGGHFPKGGGEFRRGDERVPTEEV